MYRQSVYQRDLWFVFLALNLWFVLCCNCKDNQAFVAMDTRYRHILHHM